MTSNYPRNGTAYQPLQSDRTSQARDPRSPVSDIGHDPAPILSASAYPQSNDVFDFEVPEPQPQRHAVVQPPVEQHIPVIEETPLPRAPPAANKAFTENVGWARPLGTWDVAALIMNKMIGAGFFTTPGIVLSLTGSKWITIILWILGGIYSLISFSIYLEYGLTFKFNGGDLIYVSSTSDHLFQFTDHLDSLMSVGHLLICYQQWCIQYSSYFSVTTPAMQ